MKQEGNFTQIPNAFILNPNIKNPELRLLQYIMMFSNNRTITTKNCVKHLGKSKPSITSSFEKLISLGILKIDDETIEVVIPEEMKKYTLGYFKDKENIPDGVKKTLPSEPVKISDKGKENFTTEVKKTLLTGKGNFTTEVKKIDKKPLESIDNKRDINPVILTNTTRVLPVPAKSGSTEQSHSNNNTKSNTDIELDLECDSLQSQASPSVLAPSLHTPKGEVEKVNKQSSLPVNEVDKVTKELSKPINEVSKISKELSSPIVDELSQSKDNLEPIPVEPDKRFFEQLKEYNTSIYFLPKNLDKVKSLYMDYAKEYPNKFMKIKDFEKVLICLMNGALSMVKLRGINFCLIYNLDIRGNFKYIPQVRKDMLDYPEETTEILKKSELSESE
jgi:hypothetical protein